MIQDLEQIAGAWPLLLTVLLATTGLLAAFFLTLDFGTRIRAEWMGIFFIGVPIALVAGVLINRRSLALGEDSPFRADFADAAAGNWISRGITALCLVIAVERIVRFVIRREFHQAKGMGVVLALMGYIGAVNLLAGLFGSPGGLNHHLIYAPIIALGVQSYAQTESQRCFAIVRNTLFVFLLASLAMLVVRPEMVAETHYRAGLIASVGLRFYGFATHPNTLAPLCLILLCSLRLRPFKVGLVHRFAALLAFVCLVLTQSKTSIILVLAGAAYFWFLDRHSAAAAAGTTRQREWQAQSVTVGFVAIGLIGLVMLLALLFYDPLLIKLSYVVDRLQLTTLTGRTRIWEATIGAAKDNWLFGYGPDLWGLAFRIESGLPFTHAHNQFIHTFGAAGVVGLFALVVYLVMLGRMAWQARSTSRGVTLVLFLFLLIRGLTELPLNVSNAMQGEFIIQMFLLVVGIGALQMQDPSPANKVPVQQRSEPRHHISSIGSLA